MNPALKALLSVIAVIFLAGCQHHPLAQREIIIFKDTENGFMSLIPCEILINGKVVGTLKSESIRRLSISDADVCLSVGSLRWEPDAKGGFDYDPFGKAIQVYSNVEMLKSEAKAVYFVKAVRSGVDNGCDHVGWKITRVRFKNEDSFPLDWKMFREMKPTNLKDMFSGCDE